MLVTPYEMWRTPIVPDSLPDDEWGDRLPRRLAECRTKLRLTRPPKRWDNATSCPVFERIQLGAKAGRSRKMKRRWIGVGLAASLALGLYALSGAPAQERPGTLPRSHREARVRTSGHTQAGGRDSQSDAEEHEAAEEVEFDGKLVVLSLQGSTQPSLLEHPRFKKIHGRAFVVGKEAKATFSTPRGIEAHVAWDNVTAFYVFDDVEQYEATVRTAIHDAQGAVHEAVEGFFRRPDGRAPNARREYDGAVIDGTIIPGPTR
jgi:hypothetical protein